MKSMFFALFTLAATTACGPSISSLRINCNDPAGGHISWRTSGDKVTLYASKPTEGTGKVRQNDTLKFQDRDTIFWITAADGDDKVTTGVACR